jgi:hypothetical protein
MAHRLTNVPMSPRHYQDERDKIINIGLLNGYNNKFTDDIIKKHERKVLFQSCSTMFPRQNSQSTIFTRTIAIPYHPNLSKNLRKVFEPFNIRTVQTSNIFKIKNKLESTKSKIPHRKKFLL